jgi:hypothetical protein
MASGGKCNALLWVYVATAVNSLAGSTVRDAKPAQKGSMRLGRPYRRVAMPLGNAASAAIMCLYRAIDNVKHVSIKAVNVMRLESLKCLPPTAVPFVLAAVSQKWLSSKWIILLAAATNTHNRSEVLANSTSGFKTTDSRRVSVYSARIAMYEQLAAFLFPMKPDSIWNQGETL